MDKGIVNPFDAFWSISEEERRQRAEFFSSLNKEEQSAELLRAHEEALRMRGESFDEALDKLEDEDFKRDLSLARIIAERVKERGGRALAVGGFVRDICLRRFGYGAASKDIDLEVYGIEVDELKEFLKEVVNDPLVQKDIGMKAAMSIDEVGKNFGVIKLLGLDVSVPRRDSKTRAGEGRKPKVEYDQDMSPKEAAYRRDLTINALAMDPLTGQILDYYGGLEDIQDKVLRHIYKDDPKGTQFTDDPLRVLRAMQFAARFEFSVAPETAELCRSLDLSALANERIGEEWNKLLLKSAKPSYGLTVAQDLLILEKLHPELNEALQDNDSKAKIFRSVDQAAAICRRDVLPIVQRKRLLIASLCQAFAKEPDTLKFLKQIDVNKKDHKAVITLLERADDFCDIDSDKQESDYLIRKLAYNLAKAGVGLTLKDEFYAVWAQKLTEHLSEKDLRDLRAHYSEGEIILRRAEELGVFEKPPVCVLSGNDLMDMGVKPGQEMGNLLKELFEAQLKGEFDDENYQPIQSRAVDWVRERLNYR